MILRFWVLKHGEVLHFACILPKLCCSVRDTLMSWQEVIVETCEARALWRVILPARLNIGLARIVNEDRALRLRCP